ncbi:hypothetical protein ACKU27_00085 [Sphingobium yanoikuyae]|uniref:hypothetical protein n=1 Tax=Sphingobium yanoikuyae TaxID=13690 RepID=UPI003B917B95
MATDPKDGAQDQADVQDDQIDDVPEEGLTEPPGDADDIARDKIEEEAAHDEEKDQSR